MINWDKNEKRKELGTIENKIFSNTQKLIAIRNELHVIKDKKNLTWLDTGNKAVAGFLRAWDDDRVYCIFNFGNEKANLSWYTFKQNGMVPTKLYDYWSENRYDVGYDHQFLTLNPYQFLVLEPM
jgi:amylosucrase